MPATLLAVTECLGRVSFTTTLRALVVRRPVNARQLAMILVSALWFVCVEILSFCLLGHRTDITTVRTVPPLVYLFATLVAEPDLRDIPAVFGTLPTITRLGFRVDPVAVQALVVAVDRPVKHMNSHFESGEFEQYQRILCDTLCGFLVSY
jgi:hypothetical protein